MSEKSVIRQSLKMVAASYVVTLLVLGAAAYGLYEYAGEPPKLWHLAALLLLFIPIKQHISARLLSVTIDEDHLTLEEGILSRTRRTVDLGKVQDVTATQSIWERLLGTGDLTVETAGERSSIFVENINQPRKVADLILERSRQLARARSQSPGV